MFYLYREKNIYVSTVTVPFLLFLVTGVKSHIRIRLLNMSGILLTRRQTFGRIGCHVYSTVQFRWSRRKHCLDDPITYPTPT